MKIIILLLNLMFVCSYGYCNLVDDSYIVARDRSIRLDVIQNDNFANICGPGSNGTPAANISATNSLISDNGGTLVFHSDNTVTYTPALGFAGRDRFVYGVESNPVGPIPCDTAEVFLWVLSNVNCDTTRGVNYSYTINTTDLTVNLLPNSIPPGYTFQMSKLYVNGNFYNFSGSSVTQSIGFPRGDTLIIGVEEFFLNNINGDTCLFYKTDTIVKPDCDPNYNVGYTYSFEGPDTLVLTFDTVKPVGGNFALQTTRRVTINGVIVNPSGINRYNLNQFSSPRVLCVEEWWNPSPFNDTCIYVSCDTLSTSGGTSSIVENNIHKSVNVFPNPANELINFQLTETSSNGLFSITIYNVLGEEIINYQLMGNTNSLSLSSYKSGTYIYVISNQKGYRQTGRFIKE